MTDFDPRALRNAFGSFMTGVTVVTTHDANGIPLGFTANSFTSVSLDPPLVLVCLANSSSNYQAFSTAKGFAVNILSETQQNVSNIFARPSDDRFADINWHKGPAGNPLLADVSAWFDCATWDTKEAGDHLILIGEVKAFENTPTPGLGYARGAYVTAAAEREALSSDGTLLVSALIEYQGRVLLQKTNEDKLALPERPTSQQGTNAALSALIEASGTDAAPGFIYALYDDDKRKTQHIAFLSQATSDTCTQGTFVELTEGTLARLADPAQRTMLQRFASERRVGHFRTYYGNQLSGETREGGAS